MSKRGRLAKTTSFLVKHSSASWSEETMRARRDPNRRVKMGPYLAAMLWKFRWIGR